MWCAGKKKRRKKGKGRKKKDEEEEGENAVRIEPVRYDHSHPSMTHYLEKRLEGRVYSKLVTGLVTCPNL